MTSTFHTSEEKLALLQELLEAKAAALSHGDPPFSQVKLRFNIGTQLFHRAPQGGYGSFLTGGPVKFQDIKRAKVKVILSVR
jgi:hypothetical protein